MELRSLLFGAGRGRRLRPLTDLLPKPALPLLDVPLGAWGLAALTRGAPPVVVNASYLGSELIDVLARLPFGQWQPFLEQPEAYGTAGTLHALKPEVKDRLLTWNADVVTSLEPELLVEHHLRSGAPATVAVRRVEEGADLRTSGDRVGGFIDRRKTPHEAGAQFLGIAMFERSALDLLPDHRPAGLGETLLRMLAARGDLAIYGFDGYWADIGTKHRYLQTSLDLLYGHAPSAPVALPGELVEVEAGRAYVGRGAHVAKGSLGAGAMVLAGARVDEGARVENSVVFPGTPVPAGAALDGDIWLGRRVEVADHPPR